jgi:hypothetical protein
MKHDGRSPGTMTLHDLIIFPIPNIARNANLGSFETYPHFAGVLPTGLIGAFLILFFPITGLWAYNPEYSILPGEKPASLFPFGWQIVVFRDL